MGGVRWIVWRGPQWVWAAFHHPAIPTFFCVPIPCHQPNTQRQTRSPVPPESLTLKAIGNVLLHLQ